MILQNQESAFVGLTCKYKVFITFLQRLVTGRYPEPEKSGFGKEVVEGRKNKRKDER